MQKLYKIKVDISKKNVMPAFEVNTNDLKSIRLSIEVLSNASPLDLSDKTVRIAIRKPDNNIVFQDCEIADAESGQVEVTLENQAYSTPGTHTAEIMCYKGSDVVAVSGTFFYKSTKGIMNDEAVESKSEFTAITLAINEAKQLLEDVIENGGGGGAGIDEQARQNIQEITTQLEELEQKVEEGGVGVDEQARQKLEEVTAQLVNASQGIPLSPLSNVVITSDYASVLPITYHDGWLYGFKNNRVITKSNDNGNSWVDVNNTPFGSVHSILWTNDGEVIITNSTDIAKSSGWSNNPATATWNIKVTKSNQSGVGILPWGIDGDGKKFIATEYSGADRSESRYVWISVDMGETWKIVIDKFSIDSGNSSHMHGVCYDKWADRFFLSHGHGILRGVYYSDDNGSNWNKIGGEFQPDAAPTTLYATDNGIVCGSDSPDAGLYGIARTLDPKDMQIKRTARWNVDARGVPGFAYRSFRDESTGQVYVAFKSDLEKVPSVIMGGTATTGAVVWESPTKGASKFLYMSLTSTNIIGVIEHSNSQHLIKGFISKPGVHTFDAGNTQSGVSENSTSIAIGLNARVSSADEVVIGTNATLETSSSKTGNVVVGSGAKGSARSVSIGYNAKSEGVASDTVVMGNSAKASAVNAIAIGNGATVNSGGTGAVALGKGTEAYTGGVAIGNNAKTGATSSNAVAIGTGASSGSSQVAVGANAKSSHSNSIALGSGTSTSTNDQLNIGARHIELTKLSEPANSPADSGRLFVKEGENGKLQFCVKLGSNTIVLATQP